MEFQWNFGRNWVVSMENWVVTSNFHGSFHDEFPLQISLLGSFWKNFNPNGKKHPCDAAMCVPIRPISSYLKIWQGYTLKHLHHVQKNMDKNGKNTYLKLPDFQSITCRKPSLKLTARPWKSMVGRWHFLLGPGLFSGVNSLLASERGVCHIPFSLRNPISIQWLKRWLMLTIVSIKSISGNKVNNGSRQHSSHAHVGY